MMQSVLTHGTKSAVMPVVGVRLVTGSLIMSLWKLGMKKEARDLLPSYEQLYVIRFIAFFANR